MTDVTWPLPLDGIVETVTATPQPDGSWNQAALGVRGAAAEDAVRARTWGATRTRRNFARTGQGYVQFLTDPVVFVEAALGIRETTAPVEDAAGAAVEVTVHRHATGTDAGTEWVEWTLTPKSVEVTERTVPHLSRGTAAVVELTVAASRLDVPAYDASSLRDRMAYYARIVGRCGSPRDRAALDRIVTLTDWSPPAGVGATAG